MGSIGSKMIGSSIKLCKAQIGLVRLRSWCAAAAMLLQSLCAIACRTGSNCGSTGSSVGSSRITWPLLA